eukprot:TRINITY_DN25354_c0_g1_i1.p1 TRINITY_DN25354_c0_g1~~TRINITY_DN25354_c0_g1_i1.p1  ORF type:complete len:771 (+),score=196.29 TRINITY_DN25354_c0_g1_i1:147-2459(+)
MRVAAAGVVLACLWTLAGAIASPSGLGVERTLDDILKKAEAAHGEAEGGLKRKRHQHPDLRQASRSTAGAGDVVTMTSDGHFVRRPPAKVVGWEAASSHAASLSMNADVMGTAENTEAFKSRESSLQAFIDLNPRSKAIVEDMLSGQEALGRQADVVRPHSSASRAGSRRPRVASMQATEGMAPQPLLQQASFSAKSALGGLQAANATGRRHHVQAAQVDEQKAHEAVSGLFVVSLVLNIVLFLHCYSQGADEDAADRPAIKGVETHIAADIQGQVHISADGGDAAASSMSRYVTAGPALAPTYKQPGNALDLWRSGFLGFWLTEDEFRHWRLGATPAPQATVAFKDVESLILQEDNSIVELIYRAAGGKQSMTLKCPSPAAAKAWKAGFEGIALRLNLPLAGGDVTAADVAKEDRRASVVANAVVTVEANVKEMLKANKEGLLKNLDAVQDATKGTQVIYALVLVLLFLGSGFWYGHMRMGWSVTDTVYFMIVTLSTVGYGDYDFTLDGSEAWDRYFGAVWGFAGIVFTSAAALYLGDTIREQMNEHLAEVKAESGKSLDIDNVQDAEDVLNQERRSLYEQAISGIVQMMGMTLGGALGMMYLEDWPFSDAIYWSSITLTTIGYGDLSPTKDSSKWFTVVFILLDFFVVMSALSFLGAMPFELRALESQHSVLTQFGDSLEDKELDELLASDVLQALRNPKQISAAEAKPHITRAEFILCQMLLLEKVDIDNDVGVCSRIFDRPADPSCEVQSSHHLWRAVAHSLQHLW